MKEEKSPAPKLSKWATPKPCRRCGTLFSRRKGPYCSSECGLAALHDNKVGKAPSGLIRGHKASVNTKPDERNHSAKVYHLTSPAGERFTFRNLLHFVRTHAHLFAPEDVLPHPSRPKTTMCRATVGLGQLHADRSETHRKTTWKGWRWDQDAGPQNKP